MYGQMHLVIFGNFWGIFGHEHQWNLDAVGSTGLCPSTRTKLTFTATRNKRTKMCVGHLLKVLPKTGWIRDPAAAPKCFEAMCLFNTWIYRGIIVAIPTHNAEMYGFVRETKMQREKD